MALNTTLGLVTTSEGPLPLVRRDMLPDSMPYPDTGCAVSPACLACPLPRCLYDEPPRASQQLVLATRDREIALIRRRYRAPVRLLATTYGLRERTIYRILAEQAGRPRRRRRAS